MGGGYSEKLSIGSGNLHMTSKGMGDIFKGYFADTCRENILLLLIGGRPQCHVYVDTGVKTTIGVSRNYLLF